MKKIIGMMLAMVMLAVIASAAMAEFQGTDMYVYTKNGKNLYVRSSMTTRDDSNIIGSLKYGTKVVTYGGNFNGWTLIDYGDFGDAYVMYRYLVKEKPAPYTPSSSTTPAQKTAEFSSKEAATVAQLNSLTASARVVSVPYTVTVRPTRASGWVYLRWFPSKSAEVLATFNANKQLTVLAELKDWYQVSDPDTGRVGFVYKSYVQ